MGTTPKIVELKPLANFRMWVRYDDGSQGEVDFVDLAGRGVFSAWEIGRSLGLLGKGLRTQYAILTSDCSLLFPGCKPELPQKRRIYS